MGIVLRLHQREAVRAVVREYARPTDRELRAGDGPHAGLRAQVVAATGSGKTLVGAAVAARVAAEGRVLVLVPTLDLLTQTVAVWRRAGRGGAMVAVCSLKDDPALDAARVRCTTSPPQFALWTGGGRHVTVFGTYASLGVLLEAHAGTYGLRVPGWDLVVVDEAHRTSGWLGKAWAAVHDNRLVPAERRLYLTATPRIWEPPQESARAILASGPAESDTCDIGEGDGRAEGVFVDVDQDDVALVDEDGVGPGSFAGEGEEYFEYASLPRGLAASMDDERMFGRVVFRLSLAEAVRRGIAAPLRVIVVELADPVLQDGSDNIRDVEERAVSRGARLAALQTAMLSTAAEYGLRRVATFHHRTVEAEAFAKGLPEALRRLRDGDPKSYPAAMWAEWLSGEHDAIRRRRVLGEFAAGVDRNGGTVERAFLSNCRVLAEGVDVPAIDSVAILDPKGSIVEIVQAVGRAVRPSERGDKIASIVVPIFLEAGETPDDMLHSPSWHPLVRVLHALAAHDADIVDVLAVPRAGDDPRALPVGSNGERKRQQPLLLFPTRRDPVELLRFVRTRVLDPQSRNWLRGYAAAIRYHDQNGHLRVPLDSVDIDHHHVKFPLGGWISEQRREHTLGRLDGERVAVLEELGMVWKATDQAWLDGLAIAREYARLHGHLAAPLDAAVDGFPIGQFLQNRRRRARALDKHPERREALDALDPHWNPQQWSVEWQRHLHHVGAHLVRAHAARRDGDVGGLVPGEDGVRFGDDVDVPLPEAGTLHRAVDIGQWIARQRERWNELNPAQRDELGRLGVPAPVVPPVKPARPGGAKAGRSRDEAFTLGLAAAAAYRAREGHLEVPRKHTETVTGPNGAGEDVKLGVWVTNTRTRHDKLPAERVAALDELGMRWT
ncbi:DEAD/DEAH box helicase [Streptomyces sp. SID3343]|uniref:DEAD/DEAH box helicase n=1 Tax=Streptomyces sp. SID3343 TaxID=2690260 RepID=UPI0013688FF1|nr:DEAD/DEAH box helicase [Streptomyces sp. SID3343]MYW04790.1 DEAD/DEAH box helicase family protein [Streptomyces sp. SID3343]